MLIVSDFDGVLTDQTEEGHRVRALFRDELIRRAFRDAATIDRVLERADREMDARPHRHGWRVSGRITAFVNEDLFVRNNALAACLDGMAAGGDAEASALLARIRDPGIA